MAEKRQYNRTKREKRYSDSVELEAKKYGVADVEEVPPLNKSRNYVPPTNEGTVNAANGLNARKTPGGDVVKVLQKGTSVSIDETKNVDGITYYHITKPFAAWVMARFVKVD